MGHTKSAIRGFVLKALLTMATTLLLTAGVVANTAWALSESSDVANVTGNENSLIKGSLNLQTQSADSSNKTLVAGTEGGTRSHDYSLWGSPSKSFLCIGAGGSLERVYYNDELVVETMAKDLKSITSKKTIKKSTFAPSNIGKKALRWGGFLSGANNNYVITGQMNDRESNDVVVYRVTKYTKGWKYEANVELKGIGVKEPFQCGSCAMLESNGLLYILVGQVNYKLSDGLNHQWHDEFLIDEDSMTVLDDANAGWVSHSFNQYLAELSGKVFCADHGDAHPRGMVLNRYYGNREDRDADRNPAIVFLPLLGKTGENETGASLGGFEASESTGKLLAVGNLVDQERFVKADYDDDGLSRNVWLAVIDPVSLEFETKQLTSLPVKSKKWASTPLMVKINDNKFLVMWELMGGSNSNRLRFQFVDGNGAPLSSTYKANGSLSDCKPIVYNGKVVWYVSDGNVVTFYRLTISNGKVVARKVAPSVNPMEVEVGSFLYELYGRVKRVPKDCKVELISVEDAKGKVAFKKLSGSKSISVNKKTGKITIKKGTKPGKHRIKIRVRAAGNKQYLPKSKKITVDISVKWFKRRPKSNNAITAY